MVTSLPAGNVAEVLDGEARFAMNVVEAPAALSAEGRALLDDVSLQSPGQRNHVAADPSLCR